MDGVTLRMLMSHLAPLHPLRDGLYVGQEPDGGERVSVGFVPEEAGPTQYIMLNSAPCKRIEHGSSAGAEVAAWQVYVGRYRLPFDTITVRLERGAVRPYPGAERGSPANAPGW